MNKKNIINKINSLLEEAVKSGIKKDDIEFPKEWIKETWGNSYNTGDLFHAIEDLDPSGLVTEEFATKIMNNMSDNNSFEFIRNEDMFDIFIKETRQFMKNNGFFECTECDCFSKTKTCEMCEE